MQNSPEHKARNFFQKGFHSFSAFEHKAIETILKRLRSNSASGSSELTLGQRLADHVASFGGSWTFILLFAGFLVGWVILNTFILKNLASGDQFDPYPYILLNLFLSMLAAIQAPIIMMSQNRQAENDRKASMEDFEVNLKSEMEILSLHEKMDDLRVAKWEHLLKIQQEQITMLTTMFKKHLEEGHKQGDGE